MLQGKFASQNYNPYIHNYLKTSYKKMNNEWHSIILVVFKRKVIHIRIRKVKENI